MHNVNYITEINNHKENNILSEIFLQQATSNRLFLSTYPTVREIAIYIKFLRIWLSV
jgi:hypothetical protein